MIKGARARLGRGLLLRTPRSSESRANGGREAAVPRREVDEEEPTDD